MTGMVERCARALLASESNSELSWDDLDAITREAFKRDARAVLEALREPTPEMVEAMREAFLDDMRDRKLLKYLFADEPENCVAYGYVERPIDLETQSECATVNTAASWSAAITAALSPQV